MKHHWNEDWLISHELAHIEQYERYGTLNFLFKYFTLLIKHGYEKHPLEIEARKYEKLFLHRMPK